MSSGAPVEIYAASSGFLVGLFSHWARFNRYPQFDGNLRRLDIQSDGSLLMLRGPGQPRLDSGSPSAGWFPLPDAVARALGLPPICPHSPSSMSLEQHWVSKDCKQVVTMNDNCT